MKCPSCGMENEEGSKFCRSCGANMGEAAGQSAGQSAPPPPPPSGGTPPPPPPPRPVMSRGTGSTEIDWGWIGTAFNEVFSDIGSYILMGLVVGIVSSVTFGILAGPLIGGSLYIIRRKLRGQGKVDIGEIFNVGFNKFGPTFIFTFGTTVVIGIGLWLINMIPVLGQLVSIAVAAFIVPFIGIGLHYIMEENIDFMDAAKNSWAVMSKNLLMICVFGLVTAIIMDVGIIVCVVGIFVTIPVSAVMVALMLESFFPARK